MTPGTPHGHPYAMHLNMVAASICFASMAACVHWLGAHMHWSVVTFFRMFLSVLLLLAFVRTRGIPIVVFGPRALWVRSIAGSIGMLCNFYGMTLLPISDALAMLHTAPIWIAVIRRVMFRDRLDFIDIVCIAGSVVGVFLVESASFQVEPWGVAVTLTGAFFVACAFTSMRYLAHIPPQSVTIHFSTMGAVVALGAFLVTLPGSSEALPPANLLIGGLLLTALLGSFAQVFLTVGLSRGHTVAMSLIGLLQVPFAALYDRFIWHQDFSTTKLLGFAIVLGFVGLMSARHRGNAPAPTGPRREGRAPARP